VKFSSEYTQHLYTAVAALLSVIKKSMHKTTTTTQSVIQNTRAIQRYWGPKQQRAQIMNTWSFFIIGSSLSLLPVNKYIILTIKIVQSVLWATQLIWGKAVFHQAPHSEGIEGMEVQHIQLHTFLTQALERYKWFASWPRCSTLTTDWTGGWDDLRSCLDVLKMRKKISLPYWRAIYTCECVNTLKNVTFLAFETDTTLCTYVALYFGSRVGVISIATKLHVGQLWV
jgi:hypothetical protein